MGNWELAEIRCDYLLGAPNIWGFTVGQKATCWVDEKPNLELSICEVNIANIQKLAEHKTVSKGLDNIFCVVKNDPLKNSYQEL